MHNKGFEFSFTWLFVVLVGASILALAVFASFQFIQTEGQTYQTKVAAELGAVLSPLETGVESLKSYDLALPGETRISTTCETQGTFGTQSISTSVRSGIGKAWNSNGLPHKLMNKFVFVESGAQGTAMHVLAAPLMMPYAWGDILVLYTKSYCFVNPPEAVNDELIALGIGGFKAAPTRATCPPDSVTVCFNGNGCDLSVQVDPTYSDQGIVTQGQSHLPYYGPLLYAALVSDPSVYACQLTRLRKRGAVLADLYTSKTQFLTTRGCGSGLPSALQQYKSELLNERITFNQIVSDAEALGKKNEPLTCPLF